MYTCIFTKNGRLSSPKKMTSLDFGRWFLLGHSIASQDTGSFRRFELILKLAFFWWVVWDWGRSASNALIFWYIFPFFFRGKLSKIHWLTEIMPMILLIEELLHQQNGGNFISVVSHFYEASTVQHFFEHVVILTTSQLRWDRRKWRMKMETLALNLQIQKSIALWMLMRWEVVIVVMFFCFLFWSSLVFVVVLACDCFRYYCCYYSLLLLVLAMFTECVLRPGICDGFWQVGLPSRFSGMIFWQPALRGIGSEHLNNRNLKLRFLLQGVFVFTLYGHMTHTHTTYLYNPIHKNTQKTQVFGPGYSFTNPGGFGRGH